ncbi:type II toxin-antitoxin system PemK/MazF family toxin [Pseudomonas sp. WS 5532]|uniref:type II toxin-antitoxin system PemK/MazF family toxin n=1 Tax=Pseudomonas sp. WS 5532 TaxID=2717495 RepID=UPI0021CD0AA3|nr:type II toxin-antitoxin system PemK/MazF family toxin [Pseudomonas sp. WS 5532]
MKRRKVKFCRGDIVHLPAGAATESSTDTLAALVLSPVEFNNIGLALVAPITQETDYRRFAGFAVDLTNAGTATKGAVLINMIRNMDLDARDAKKVECVPDEIVQDALARLKTFVEP